MDQKATSVADIAAILTIQEEKAEQAAAREDETAGKEQTKLSHRARKRIARTRRLQQQHEEEVKERIGCMERALSSKDVKVKITDEGELERKDVSEGEVKILWADIQDTQYAKSWPKGVIHGELSPSKGHIIGNQLAFQPDMSGQATDTESNADEQSEQEVGDAIVQAPIEEKDVKPTSKTVLSRLKFWKD
jgi:hypothetical protein